MPDYQDNSSSSLWQRTKARFLSLSWRFQIAFGIGIVALIGIGVFALVGGPFAVPGVKLSLEPGFGGGTTIAPGELVPLDLFLDTAGEDVVAVSAYIDFDNTVLDISCSGAQCQDVFVDSQFPTIAEKQVVNNQLRIVVGTTIPVNGNGIKVASIVFFVPSNANPGPASITTTVSFDTTNSAVIQDDGFGTDILDQVDNLELTVLPDQGTPTEVIVSNVQAIISGCDATITWETNIDSNSELFSCPGNVPIAQCAATPIAFDLAETSTHSLDYLGTVCDQTYWYFVQSTATGGAADQSQVLSFFTGTIESPVQILEISNLSAEPRARSATISWNTNLLADSSVTLKDLNIDTIIGTRSSSIPTLSHSIRFEGLQPLTNYKATATSEAGALIDTKTITFQTTSEDTTLDSNIIVSARRDRICDTWFECTSSIDVVSDTDNTVQSLCFDYALCDKLDPATGACLNIIRPKQDIVNFSIFKDDPVRSSIDEAVFTAGVVTPGAEWEGFGISGDPFADGFITGFAPYAQMEQEGSSLTVANGDLEAKISFPWRARFYESGNPRSLASIRSVPADRTGDTTVAEARALGYVLEVRPIDQPEGVSGVKIPIGKTIRNDLQYYVSMDVRAANPAQMSELIVQFGFKNYSSFTQQGTDFIPLSSGWQRVIAGPLEARFADLPGIGEQTFLGFLIKTSSGETYEPFYLDNVAIEPVLNVGGGKRIARTCRAYPTDDAPSCRYFDISTGRQYKGLEGYCVEVDPRNTRRCIKWLPVDIIASSHGLVSSSAQAGYGTNEDERAPMYYCVEAKGNAPYERAVTVGTGADDEGDQVELLGNEGHEWKEESGLVIFDAVGFRDSKLKNLGDLYIFEIEQITVTIIDGDADDYPVGARYSLNRSNGWEAVDCSTGPEDSGDENFCPENPFEAFGDPNVRYYWKNVVDSESLCEDWGNKGGRIKSSDPDDNLIGFAVNFDDSGKLVNIQSGLCDGSNGDGWFRGQVTIYLREWCTTVAQVVNPFGDNKAWAQAIQFDSVDGLDLAYERGQDYPPFGSVVAPEPDFDPSQWDSSEDERGFQPLFIEPPAVNNPSFFQPPHQARGGSPYGVLPTGRITIDGFCSAPPSSVGRSCLVNPTCDSEVGICDVGINGRCIGGPTPGDSCNPVISGVCGAGGLCGGTCTSGPNVGNTCFLFGNQCGSGDGICGLGITQSENTVGTGTCVSGSNIGRPCDTHQSCGNNLEGGSGRCTGVLVPPTVTDDAFLSRINNRIEGRTRISRLFAQSLGIWLWDTSLLPIRYRQLCSAPGECIDTEGIGPVVNRIYGWDITGDQTITKPPRVDNIRIAGGFIDSFTQPNEPIRFTRGTGGVVFEFNSEVEPNQMPLVRYTVDWTDERIVEESALKIAPKVSRDKPHRLSHTYFCDGPQSPGWNPSIGACEFKPRIQIEDNWGWCSGTPADGIMNYSGNIACNSWDEFDSVIIVCPLFGAGIACNEPPHAVFTATPSSGRVPLSVNFDASASFDSDGTIQSYAWKFGDGGVGSGIQVSYEYTTADTYQAELTVTDDQGTQDTDVTSINVQANINPIADAGFDQTVTDDNGDGFETVTLNGSGSDDPDGSIVEYDWSEGDTSLPGSPSSNPTLSATLPVGLHTIILTVTDNDGGTGTDTVVIDVNPAIVSLSLPDEFVKVSEPKTIPITVSDTTGLNITSYDITISFENQDPLGPNLLISTGATNDNMTASWPAPTVVTSIPNEVTVSGSGPAALSGSGTLVNLVFQALSDEGIAGLVFNNTLTQFNNGYPLINTTNGTLKVSPNIPPNAKAVVYLTSVGLPGSPSISVGSGADITFHGSSDPDGTVDTYQWTNLTTVESLGQNEVQNITIQAPQFQQGDNTIKLTVTDDKGATGTDTVTVTILPNQAPQIVLSADVTTGVPPLTVTFTGSIEEFDIPKNYPVAITLDFDDGTSVFSDTVNADGALTFPPPFNPHMFSSSGVYNVTLTATDSGIPPETSSDQVAITVDWWDVRWQHRRKLVFQNAGRSALTDFPALVRLTNIPVGYQDTRTDGSDVRFIDDNGNDVLTHEIEDWNDSSDAYFWVRVPRLEGSDSDFIWIYYGYDGVGSPPFATLPEQTWDPDFMAVHHMEDTLDSTGNDVDGTNNGAAIIPGQVSNAYEFVAGQSDYIDLGSHWALNIPDELSVFAWLWFYDVNDGLFGNSIVEQCESSGFGGQFEYMIGRDPANSKISAGWHNMSARLDSTDTVTTGQWYYVGYTRIGVPGDWDANIYINGAPSGSASSINQPSGTWHPTAIGRCGAYDGLYFDGRIDEVRISNLQRDANWISAEYDTMKNPGTFIDWGQAGQQDRGNPIVYLLNQRVAGASDAQEQSDKGVTLFNLGKAVSKIIEAVKEIFE